ncbi:MAG: winged helix-turn-helix domain-containing protein [Lachnospiraceae bacterium]
MINLLENALVHSGSPRADLIITNDGGAVTFHIIDHGKGIDASALPNIEGNDIITAVRSWTSCPIIVVSARTGERDKVTALDPGADDYITKPFGTPEMLARIRASLRHGNRMESNSALYIRPYQCQGLVLDFDKRMLTLNGDEIHLTQIEYKIVAFLARNSGKVMTYSAIMSNVWGPFTGDNNRILRVNMANIRRKIEQNPSQPRFLFTEVGVGYRMREDENEL